jgi:MraZ protein
MFKHIPQTVPMLRGHHTARIDEKGRLKIPTHFRRRIEEHYNSNVVYVTSVEGLNVRIYPMKEWEAIEQRLLLLPTMSPERRKFLDRTTYFGQEAEIDQQGRVLIHPLLRRKAGIIGEVAVLGYLIYLEIWEHDAFQQNLFANPFTAEDESTLARYGI